jgi:predicted acylesterase/phospholipase RssA
MRTTILICSILLLAYAKQDHCYALALEGGGDKGAYQAGALHEIIKHHNDETVAYDIVTGISVGAINGAGMANFEKGQENEAADFILELWRGLSKDEVYKNWHWGGVVRGILFKTGIYNDSPLIKYLTEHVEAPKRKFLYGLVDAANGKYITMDETEPMDRYINGIVGSATFPGVFPVMDKLDKGKQYYDGGVARVVDIAGAVNYCKD